MSGHRERPLLVDGAAHRDLHASASPLSTEVAARAVSHVTDDRRDDLLGEAPPVQERAEPADDVADELAGPGTQSAPMAGVTTCGRRAGAPA